MHHAASMAATSTETMSPNLMNLKDTMPSEYQSDGEIKLRTTMTPGARHTGEMKLDEGRSSLSGSIDMNGHAQKGLDKVSIYVYMYMHIYMHMHMTLCIHSRSTQPGLVL